MPTLADLPLPDAVAVGRDWQDQMREMADHIGAKATLAIVDRFGGQRLSIPRNWEQSPFRHLVDSEAARTIAWIYGGCRFQVPTAKAIISRMRRAGVIAAARKRLLTISDAARIIGSSRSYVTHLVNETREGWDTVPIDIDSLRGEILLKRTLAKLVEHLCAAGVASGTIAAIWSSIFVALGAITDAPHADDADVLLLRRAADAVVAELSAFDVDPDAVDAACGAVLSLLHMEDAPDAS